MWSMHISIGCMIQQVDEMPTRTNFDANKDSHTGTQNPTHLHLEHIRAALDREHEVLQHVALVQPEAAGEVRDRRVQQQRRKKVGAAAGQHTLVVPSSDLVVYA